MSDFEAEIYYNRGLMLYLNHLGKRHSRSNQIFCKSEIDVARKKLSGAGGVRAAYNIPSGARNARAPPSGGGQARRLGIARVYLDGVHRAKCTNGILLIS